MLQHILLSLARVVLVLHLRLSKGVCLLVRFYDTDVLHTLLSYILFLFILFEVIIANFKRNMLLHSFGPVFTFASSVVGYHSASHSFFTCSTQGQ